MILVIVVCSRYRRIETLQAPIVLLLNLASAYYRSSDQCILLIHLRNYRRKAKGERRAISRSSGRDLVAGPQTAPHQRNRGADLLDRRIRCCIWGGRLIALLRAIARRSLSGSLIGFVIAHG
jgi:hypothetical protein